MTFELTNSFRIVESSKNSSFKLGFDKSISYSREFKFLFEKNSKILFLK